MKKILLASLVLAAAVGANAQNPTCNADCPKADKASCSPGECAAPGACPVNPFEGLNLTADQQTKLDALKADCKARRQEAMATAKADKEKVKADRKKAMEGMRERVKGERTAMLAKIKDILTPEQYVQFLENNFVNGADRGQRHGKDFKGPRGDKRKQAAKDRRGERK